MSKARKLNIGIIPSQENGPYWKTNGAENITAILEGMEPVKATSYLKVEYRSHGGSKTEIQYWKTLQNGYMIYVDITNCRLGIVQGIGTNRGISGATKQEFDRAFQRVLDVLTK